MGGSAGTIARIGLTAVGAVVGGAFGNPAIGALVGSTVGGLLFPQRLPGVSGPRLNDAELTVSTEGAAIPLVYGSHVVAGNIIWAAPLEEVEQTEEQGGKGGGGGQEVTTYTYYLSFALALCEGPIEGITRIWENGKLIWDNRPQFDDETEGDYNKRLAANAELLEIMTLYFGSEIQEPDPIIESFEGVDNISAHRGMAYLVFERYDVTPFGGRPPQFKVEVRASQLVYETVEEWRAEIIDPWSENYGDPRDPDNEHEYRYVNPETDDSTGWVSFSAALDAATDYTYTIPAGALDGYQVTSYLVGWRTADEPPAGAVDVAPHDSGIDAGDRVQLLLRFSGGLLDSESTYISRADYALVADPLLNLTYDALFSLGYSPGEYWWLPTAIGTLGSGGLATVSSANGVRPVDLAGAWTALSNCEPSLGCPYEGGTLYAIPDQRIYVRRAPRCPPRECSPTAADWPFDPENFCWNPDTGEIFTKEAWISIAGEFLWLCVYEQDLDDNEENIAAVVLRYPLSPSRPVGHPDSTEAFWTAAYEAAVAAGELPAGMTYQADGQGDITTYPRYSPRSCYRTYDLPSFDGDGGTTVGAIVADQCQRVGLASDEYSIAGLTESIRGYKVERVMPARDIIEPLRSYSFFDCVETDRIRFPLRGAGVVASLDDDDLAAHAPGAEPPPLVQIERIEDVELPRIVRVGHANIDAEYLAGQQIRSRQVVDSALVSDFDSTIACSDAKAAQMADVLLAQAWMGRESYKLFASPRWLALEPADGINIPVRGEIQRARIDSITQALPGILEIEAVRDGDTAGLYTSSVTGSPSGSGNQVLEPIGETTLAIIDSTALLSSHDDAGVYLAARGEGNRWRGYQLLQSTDGGSNYTGVASFAPPTTMGTLLDALPAGPYEIWDRTNTFRVAIDQGTLQTLAEATVLQGNNAAFIGADGRWMLLLFATAELLEVDEDGRSIYRLSNLLQGWQGTEWAIGSNQVGDTFALANTLQRLVLDPGAIGLPRLYKAVSFGRPVSLATAQAFTPQGNALRPWAPATIRGARDDSGNLSILGSRRTRLFGPWNDNDSVPLNEETEAYEVDVFSGGSPDVVVRVISASAFPISYTAAQQTADFGSPQTDIRVRVYQLSAVVGRGYPTEAIV